jgi:hypothetical protein
MDLAASLRPCVMGVSLGFTMRAVRRGTRPDGGPPESRSPCCRACQGAATPPGRPIPRPTGRVPGACRVCGARRPREGARLRGSLPCLHVPLSTLHGPRYPGSRLTRGQRGWLNLRWRRLALRHIVPVCLGTPARHASGAAGSRSAAEAVNRRLPGRAGGYPVGPPTDPYVRN